MIKGTNNRFSTTENLIISISIILNRFGKIDNLTINLFSDCFAIISITIVNLIIMSVPQAKSAVKSVVNNIYRSHIII